MPLVIAILALACVLALCLLRAQGYVYLGRTIAGWTSVHDDAQVLGERIRVLEVEGTYQSATYLDERWAEPVFPYHRLFDHLFDRWPDRDGPDAVAVLGGGGYAIPKHLFVHHPEVARLDVVEIDPAIERIARRHFFLDRIMASPDAGRLHLHTGDARTWLEGTEQRFDAIVNDCFLGLDPEHALMTSDAAQLVKSRLTPDGVYLTNVVSALAGPSSRTLYGVIEALGSAFAHTWIYPCGADQPDAQDNNVVIATDATCAFPGAWQWPPDTEERR